MPDQSLTLPLGTLYYSATSHPGYPARLWRYCSTAAQERWQPVATAIGKSFLDVRAHGAIGDGVVDDSVPIQRALDELGQAGGGVVFAPKGRYLFDHLSIPRGVILAGESPDATTFVRLGAIRHAGADLFGVRLAGSHAVLRDCTVEGVWDPMRPSERTFDVNVGVFGQSVHNCSVVNVRSRRAHIGFLVGGFVNDPILSFGGQSFTKLVYCQAEGTCDNGFAIVGGPVASPPTTGCELIHCQATNSLLSAGVEIRRVDGVRVHDFRSAGNANSVSGAGLRCEEASGVNVTDLVTQRCAMGVQIVNDSHNCSVVGFSSLSDELGALIRNAANIQIADFYIESSSSHAIALYGDRPSSGWVRANDQISFEDGSIVGAGSVRGGFGFVLAGPPAGLGGSRPCVVLRNLQIIGSRDHDVYVRTGHNVEIVGCALVRRDGSAEQASLAFDPLREAPRDGGPIREVARCIFAGHAATSEAIEGVDSLTWLGDNMFLGSNASRYLRQGAGMFQAPTPCPTAVTRGSATLPSEC